MWFNTVTWDGLHYWHLMVGVREAKVPSGLMEQNFFKKCFIQYVKRIPLSNTLRRVPETKSIRGNKGMKNRYMPPSHPLGSWGIMYINVFKCIQIHRNSLEGVKLSGRAQRESKKQRRQRPWIPVGLSSLS